MLSGADTPTKYPSFSFGCSLVAGFGMFVWVCGSMYVHCLCLGFVSLSVRCAFRCRCRYFRSGVCVDALTVFSVVCSFRCRLRYFSLDVRVVALLVLFVWVSVSMGYH